MKWRSDYYSTLEGGRGGYMPHYGLMHLLACFTLFDDEPQLVNTILEGFLAVTREEVLAAAQKIFAQGPAFDRFPHPGEARGAGGCVMTTRPLRSKKKLPTAFPACRLNAR